MSDTPQSLLERLRRQPDSRAWNRLVAVYTPMLRDWLRRHQLQESDADDLLLMHGPRRIRGARMNAEQTKRKNGSDDSISIPRESAHEVRVALAPRPT